ncbi:MAG: lytic transglycosylase domain-containing protein [Spirochaetia bacterium]|nr:lytic transglycosylase domain-containing protein [Spirochaetia bacterium]
MAINVINPNLTSHLKILSSSTASGKTESAGTDFADFFNASLASSAKGEMESVGAVNLDAIFQKAADTYDVPLGLLKAIGKAESNFDPSARSKSGAMGVMQLMPKTAASLGVKNAFDPVQNIMGGAKYLKDMLKQFNGNVELALAAYNAGPGNVKKHGGVPPFAETQRYIAKVMGYANQDINAGTNKANQAVVEETGPVTSGDVSGISAKDLTTMMTLYRYQIELAAWTSMSKLTEEQELPLNSP